MTQESGPLAHRTPSTHLGLHRQGLLLFDGISIVLLLCMIVIYLSAQLTFVVTVQCRQLFSA